MMYFDRFDVCEAYYCYAVHWDGGMWTREYAYLGRLKRLGFRPAPNLDVEELSENGRAIYDALVERGS